MCLDRKVLSVLLLASSVFSPVVWSCTTSSECGSNEICTLNKCDCKAGFQNKTVGNNWTVCIDELCGDGKCLKCADSLKCIRCINYVEESTGKCIDTCSTKSLLVVDKDHGTIKICPGTETEDEGLGIHVIIIIAVICGLLFLVIFIGFIVYMCRLYKSRSNDSDGIIDLNKSSNVELRPIAHSNGSIISNETAIHSAPSTSQNYVPKPLRTGRELKRRITLREMVYQRAVVKENPNFVPDEAEKRQFMEKLNNVRGDAQSFLNMLNELRKRLQALKTDEPPAEQYRLMMDDLTRVLFLVNKKPDNVQMPPDGLQLMEWAEHILTRYQEFQQQQSNQSSPAASLKSNNAVTNSQPPSSSRSNGRVMSPSALSRNSYSDAVGSH